jgi:hypothetical protein
MVHSPSKNFLVDLQWLQVLKEKTFTSGLAIDRSFHRFDVNMCPETYVHVTGGNDKL